MPIFSSATRAGKHRLAEALDTVSEAPHFDCHYHGLAVRFRFETPESLAFARDRLPASWLRQGEPKLHLHWRDADLLWSDPDSAFDDDPDPGFEVAGDVVLQRDFVARRLGDWEAVIASRRDSTDGIFNALRWFLPPALLKQGALVAHSSVIVGKDGRAHVFLGHSGAGKSTIASLAGGRTVLGDDINLIRVGDLATTAEAALLGQARFDPANLDKRSTVAGFYWLKQSPQVAARALEPGEAARALLHSCLLSDPAMAPELMELLARIVRQVPGFELSFRKDADFWEVIDG